MKNVCLPSIYLKQSARFSFQNTLETFQQPEKGNCNQLQRAKVRVNTFISVTTRARVNKFIDAIAQYSTVIAGVFKKERKSQLNNLDCKMLIASHSLQQISLLYLLFLFELRTFQRTLFCSVCLAVLHAWFVQDSFCMVDLLQVAFGLSITLPSSGYHADNVAWVICESMIKASPLYRSYQKVRKEFTPRTCRGKTSERVITSF